MTLTEGELAVLASLQDGRWRIPWEIAGDTKLSIPASRSTLKSLQRAELVERGGWGDSTRWGDYRITDAGQRALEIAAAA